MSCVTLYEKLLKSDIAIDMKDHKGELTEVAVEDLTYKGELKQRKHRHNKICSVICDSFIMNFYKRNGKEHQKI